MSPISKSKLKEVQLKFTKLDMNNSKNIREFMRILGVPFRPYQELMEEITIFIKEKQSG